MVLVENIIDFFNSVYLNQIVEIFFGHMITFLHLALHYSTLIYSTSFYSQNCGFYLTQFFCGVDQFRRHQSVSWQKALIENMLSIKVNNYNYFSFSSCF